MRVPTDVQKAQDEVRRAEANLTTARIELGRAVKQSKCKHMRVDNPGCIWGETCLDCGLYLDNGI